MPFEAPCTARSPFDTDVAAETSTRPAKYANKHSSATSMVKVETCFSFTPRLGGSAIGATGAGGLDRVVVFRALPVGWVFLLARAMLSSVRQIECQLWRFPGLRE